MTDETGRLRERIAVLEANYRHTAEQIDAMAEQMAEIHAVLLQAKGARWALVSVAIMIGFVIANLGKPLVQWLGLVK